MPVASRLLRSSLMTTVVIAVALLLGFWNGTSAWIFKADLRKLSNLSSVGVIEFTLPEGKSLGTAFLVGDCTVMTNFHVVFGPWYVTALRPPSRANVGTFTLTQVVLANGKHPSSLAIPVIWGDYTGPDRSFRKPGEDWVLLALKDCLGTHHGYLTPYDADLNEDIPQRGGFAAVGYSTGVQMIDADCTVRKHTDALGRPIILHDCAANPGDSGSPIVRQGTGRVVGIISSVHAEFESGSCKATGDTVLEEWNTQCTNIAVLFEAPLVDRVETAREIIRVQHQLLGLGYDAGPLGVLDHPQLHAAVIKFQRDSGIRPTGKIDSVLCSYLYFRALGI